MHDGLTDYPIYYINLDNDTQRRDRMERWYAGYTMRRFAGIYGATLPRAVRRVITRPTISMGGGTLGCFLSHVGVWDLIAEGEAEYGLVLEDDALPLAPLPSNLAEFGLPDDWDVCFVNQRAVPNRANDQNHPRNVLSISQALKQRPEKQTGFGADGYFLTRAGARSLLHVMGQERPMQHLDIQLVASSLKRGHPQVGVGPFCEAVAVVGGKRTSTITLKSYVAVPPLVNQYDEGVSARRSQDSATAV